MTAGFAGAGAAGMVAVAVALGAVGTAGDGVATDDAAATAAVVVTGAAGTTGEVFSPVAGADAGGVVGADDDSTPVVARGSAAREDGRSGTAGATGTDAFAGAVATRPVGSGVLPADLLEKSTAPMASPSAKIPTQAADASSAPVRV